MTFRYDWLPKDSWVYLGPAFHALARDLDTIGTPTPRDQVTAASPATAVAPYLPPADTAGRSRSQTRITKRLNASPTSRTLLHLGNIMTSDPPPKNKKRLTTRRTT